MLGKGKGPTRLLPETEWDQAARVAAAAAAVATVGGSESPLPSWKDLAWAKTRRFRRNNTITHPGKAKRERPLLPKVTLYRDAAIWCPFCEMVWLALEEKKIPYKVVKSCGLYAYGDMHIGYAVKVPEMIVPAIQIGGDGSPIVTNAYRIVLDLLESEGFPSLMPTPGTKLHKRAVSMISAHVDASKLFYKFTGLLAAGKGSISESLRWYLQALRITEGKLNLNIEYVEQALDEAFEGITDLLQDDKTGPYFLGSIFSLVDIIFAPLMERMIAIAHYLAPDKYDVYNSRHNSEFKEILAWHQAMLARPTYMHIAQDMETIIRIFKLQAAFALGTHRIANFPSIEHHLSPNSRPDVKLLLQKEGKAAASASKLTEEFRHEAASRLVTQHAAICAFAMRGRGGDKSVGFAGLFSLFLPSVFCSFSSSLTPSSLEKRLWPAIDFSLRLVTYMLLLPLEKGPPSSRCEEKGGGEEKREIGRKQAGVSYSEAAAAAAAATNASKYFEGLNDDDLVEALAVSLRFLHTRVSIPRDMSIGAGAHFRRALASVIDQVDAAALIRENWTASITPKSRSVDASKKHTSVTLQTNVMRGIDTTSKVLPCETQCLELKSQLQRGLEKGWDKQMNSVSSAQHVSLHGNAQQRRSSSGPPPSELRKSMHKRTLLQQVDGRLKCHFEEWGEASLFSNTSSAVGALLSGPVCAMLISALLTNCGVFPGGGAALSEMQRLLVKVATPLLLMSADARKIYQKTGLLLVAFALGSIATAVGATIGFLILAPALKSWGGEAVWQTAAALSAKNIGGGLNYVAVADSLKMAPASMSTGLAIDNVCGLIYFPLCSWLATKLTQPHLSPEPASSSSHPPPIKPHNGTVGNGQKAAAADMSVVPVAAAAVSDGDVERQSSQERSVESLSSAVAVALVIAAVSDRIGGACGVSGVVFSTAIAPILATLFPRAISPLAPSGEALGTLMLFLFFGSVGMAAGDWGAIAGAWPLLGFNLILYAVHILLLITTGRVLPKLDARQLLVASNANIGNAATASTFASARGWRELAVPALLVGTLGNAVGTFAGLCLGRIFHSILLS
eukprot:jgi/Bigna1/90550/estExt_fgenesh1_pg.C_730027